MIDNSRKPFQIGCNEQENLSINIELSKARSMIMEKMRVKKNTPEVFIMALKELNKHLDELI